MKRKLVSIGSLSDAIGIPVRTIRSLQYQRKIPYIHAGHRTNLFDVNKVLAALDKLEVRAV